jgi:hypothetical protein
LNQPTNLTEAVITQLAFEGRPVVVRDTIVKGLMVAVNKHSKSGKVRGYTGPWKNVWRRALRYVPRDRRRNPNAFVRVRYSF